MFSIGKKNLETNVLFFFMPIVFIENFDSGIHDRTGHINMLC